MERSIPVLFGCVRGALGAPHSSAPPPGSRKQRAGTESAQQHTCTNPLCLVTAQCSYFSLDKSPFPSLLLVQKKKKNTISLIKLPPFESYRSWGSACLPNGTDLPWGDKASPKHCVTLQQLLPKPLPHIMYTHPCAYIH